MCERPWTITAESPYGGTVRVAIWHRTEDNDWTISVGGTLPRTGYCTYAETLAEAMAFATREVSELLATHYVK